MLFSWLGQAAAEYDLHHRLLGALLLQRTLELLLRSLRLVAHDTTAPRALNRFGVLVVLLADSRHQLAEVVAVLRMGKWAKGDREGQRIHAAASCLALQLRVALQRGRAGNAPRGARR